MVVYLTIIIISLSKHKCIVDKTLSVTFYKVVVAISNIVTKLFAQQHLQ